MTELADLTDPTVVSADELLADALRPDDAPDVNDPDSPWEITGHKTADWAVNQIRAAHAQFARETVHLRDAREALEKRLAELDEHIAARARHRDHTVDFFEAHLKAWTRRQRLDEIAADVDPDKAVKSVPLAGATVKSRAGQDRIDVLDAAEVVEWAAVHDAVEVAWREPKVDGRKLRSWVRSTGVVPAGVMVEPAGEDARTYWVDYQ